MSAAQATNPASGKVANPKVVLNLGSLPPRQKPGAMMKENYPRTPSRVNPDQPQWPAYRGYHEYSFAHATMTVRLPTILEKAIADVHLTVNQEYDEERVQDLVACIHRMEDLLTNLKGNDKLRYIADDGAGDVALWNKEIARYFRGKTFMTGTWLFCEAYKYRRLRECFSLSKYWVDYDVFFRQKCDTFARSSQAVFELASRFASPFEFAQGLSAEDKLATKKLMFRELTQICLWGNSTDLSLLIDMTEEDIKKLQTTGGEHLSATEKNILGNDLDKITDKVAHLEGARIDFVLDNAGFELYCDLVYADWLIQSGVCREIVFHGKKIPWFVSDVTKKDWDWILNSCVYGYLFPEATEEEMDFLRAMGRRWKQYEKEGKFKYQSHPFWCSGFTFWSLPAEAPDLFIELAESDLVIFKGDLNHRKLGCDCHYPYNTPFSQAIGPLASTPGAPAVVSLRTIKSDIVVGVPAEIGEKLDEEEKGWKISGKYAVVLLSEGRPGEKITFADHE